MAVTTKHDQGIGPGLAQVLDKPFQHREHLLSSKTLGLENRRDQASREALIDVQGQEAIGALIAIITDVLLLALSRGLRIIEVEHDELGHPVVRGDKLIHKHPRQAVEFGA